LGLAMSIKNMRIKGLQGSKGDRLDSLSICDQSTTSLFYRMFQGQLLVSIEGINRFCAFSHTFLQNLAFNFHHSLLTINSIPHSIENYTHICQETLLALILEGNPAQRTAKEHTMSSILLKPERKVMWIVGFPSSVETDQIIE
jgi:hypothetical protein